MNIFTPLALLKALIYQMFFGIRFYAITIDKAYIETFESNIRHLAQQGTAKLRPYVTEVSKMSEKHNWDRLAASSARKKTSARMVSPAGGSGSGAVGGTDGLTYSRRVSVAETWDAGEVIEIENPVQMLIDPNAASTVNLGMAMRRAVDDLIIEACNEAALDGDGGTPALPAGQKIGGATEIISLDHVLNVQEIFNSNDVDPDEPKVFVIGPTQQRKLMQLMEVTSGDYQNAKALATGVLPNWMGFTWIVSNRLRNHTNPPTAGQLYCLAFSRKAIGLHVAKDITAKVGERTDMSFAWQLYCAMVMGAVRVEDEHIVQIHLKDALA